MNKKVVLAIVSLLLVGAACQKAPQTQRQTNQTNSPTNTAVSTNSVATNTAATVSWSFNGSTWQSSGTPPACPMPLQIKTPVDLTTVTAILYPGQVRGGNYKPHGGFRFDLVQNTEQTVTAPMDAVIYNGSRYIEQGEVQYLFTFINSCGIAYRFDHLRTLSPALQVVADTLPAAQVDNSATTLIHGKSVRAGDTLATAVGFEKTNNLSVDFGVYDLRQKNSSAGNAAWASSHNAEYGQYGVCWFDLLNEADHDRVHDLPAGDQAMGKTSDYCH